MNALNKVVLSALALAGVCLSTSANAHISLERGGTHLSRYGDSTIKAGPCGKAGGARGTHVYQYEPGTTITVSLVEYIPHPSYYRFAFDPNGDGKFKEPASIKPIDPARRCPDGPGDHCGTSDFYNTPEVLPGMDNLNPHLSSAVLPKYTWQVKLPDVECDKCTLQVIEVMEDDGAHGPYDPTPGVGVEDIYHQCIDIVLKRGTGTDGGLVDGGGPDDSGTSSMDDASVDPPADGGTQSGASPSGGNSGCSCGVGGDDGLGAWSAAWSVLAFGAVWARRRRRATQRSC